MRFFVILLLGLSSMATTGIAQSSSILVCLDDDRQNVTTITVAPAGEGFIALLDGNIDDPITTTIEDGRLNLLGDDFLGVMTFDDRLELKVLDTSGDFIVRGCFDVTGEVVILHTGYDLINAYREEVSNLEIELSAANDIIKELRNELEQLAATDGSAVEGSLASSSEQNEDQITGTFTNAERDQFFRSIARCWNVDVGAEWTRVTVTVGLTLSPDGKIDGDVRLIDANGGNDTQTAAAFQAARRAIFRCGVGGFDLPEQKYHQWKEMNVTFDPSTMRLR